MPHWQIMQTRLLITQMIPFTFRVYSMRLKRLYLYKCIIIQDKHLKNE